MPRTTVFTPTGSLSVQLQLLQSIFFYLVSVFLLDLVVGLTEQHMTGHQMLPGENCSEVHRGCDNMGNEIQVENENPSLWTDCNIGREWDDLVSSRKDLECRYLLLNKAINKGDSAIS